ncbi:hypothetical protein L210DRAFT_2684701 [Boletus edulis BED1]|uniref:Uncharacterized protein n=1 Tax=Boletus edulis BED1 TaxID=1328754 RepID=A0AAD4BM18_BOLED|nr:hypothetical protein L210DRAFT_2684701 [Boletus edulis BED1]
MYSAVTEQPIRVDYVIFNGLIYRLAQMPTVNQATFARRPAIFLKDVKNQLNPIDYGREPTSSRSILSHRPSQQRTTLSVAIPDIFSIPWPDASFQPAPPSMTFPGDRDKDVPQLQGSQDIKSLPKETSSCFLPMFSTIPNPLNDPQGHLSDTFHHPILSADVPHISATDTNDNSLGYWYRVGTKTGRFLSPTMDVAIHYDHEREPAASQGSFVLVQ